MAWKQLFDNLDDFDFEKLLALADMFWDDREKISATANMVWENRERFLAAVDYISTYQESITDVIGYIGENRERLSDLVDRLPELLETTGSGLETAGASAVRASALLTGEDATGKGKGKEPPPSAYEMAGMAAVALERCNVQLEHVAALIQELGDKIDDIRIPSVSPRYAEVMGYKVIAGIDLEETALTDDMAARFRSGADRLSEISDDFSSVSEQFQKLGIMLVHTGDNLNAVGDQLQKGGQSLQRLTKKSAKRSTAPVPLDVESTIDAATTVEAEIAQLQAEARKVRTERTGDA